MLDTRITDPGDAPDDLLGKAFQRSPGITAALGVDWRPIENVRLTAQARHSGAYFSDDANTPGLRIGSATLVDARASWTSGRATLFGYVRNAFDAFRLRNMNSAEVAIAHGPREIGIGMEMQF